MSNLMQLWWRNPTFNDLHSPNLHSHDKVNPHNSSLSVAEFGNVRRLLTTVRNGSFAQVAAALWTRLPPASARHVGKSSRLRPKDRPTPGRVRHQARGAAFVIEEKSSHPRNHAARWLIRGVKGRGFCTVLTGRR